MFHSLEFWVCTLHVYLRVFIFASMFMFRNEVPPACMRVCVILLRCVSQVPTCSAQRAMLDEDRRASSVSLSSASHGTWSHSRLGRYGPHLTLRKFLT